MDNDYVNAMFKLLQNNKSRVDCSELFGLVIKVSLSTFATFLNTFLFNVSETGERTIESIG